MKQSFQSLYCPRKWGALVRSSVGLTRPSSRTRDQTLRRVLESHFDPTYSFEVCEQDRQRISLCP
jgi:hypothetical protein